MNLLALFRTFLICLLMLTNIICNLDISHIERRIKALCISINLVPT